ncbi:hypothetical protein DIPPA_30938 [Diplonema papillatum]|nr:hypothetical protein DIPPA_30938 [Diplonema papillatum]
MLRQRLKACAVSPQWPVSTNLAKNSQSAADSQTFAFNHPAFKEELDSAELISPSDLRAGCKTRLVSETDLFMYFGSSIAGCRKPDEDISKYDIRIGYHIVPCDGRPETSGNEQLVDSCYTNALLGSTGAEQDEKSCWVAVSNTRTYFCLDLNTDRFSKAKQPFLFLSCHLNGDLSKIEIGYGMQYMRLVYGGETGSTYLLVPRCLKTTRRLLKLLTTAPNAAKDARLTVHSSPFMSRQLFQGQGAVLGYFLVFMRQDQLVTLRKDRDISYMAFPQDVYPLRELGAPMLPVSLIITKDDILVLSDRFGAWPDNEHDPSRWHIEKKLSLGDISQVCIAPAMSAVHPNRFAIDFEDEDADEEAADSGIRWNFVAQTPAAVTDVVSLVKREWEMKWRMALGIAELTSADEQPVTKKKK